ncbi:hypothetical protein [Metallosphaera javensis (ex Sakai et al. 2022)]|uniref:hypothetical protein n=1 Tax=Metallosphaera javensis (ex Sakai et al. 2022) TaxID=2775498 RepID=UPI002585420C|nr:MAG: hypothetical protein MjAS7_0140 [Metallosphaera javensis (ex Sakai et al. 2022)]
MLKNLRIKTFYPEKEYIHLTYAIRNEEERSKELIRAYVNLLNKGIKYVSTLWKFLSIVFYLYFI